MTVLSNAMNTTPYAHAPIVVLMLAPLTPDMNTKNFENIPANGGIPPSENIAKVIKKLKRGFV